MRNLISFFFLCALPFYNSAQNFNVQLGNPSNYQEYFTPITHHLGKVNGLYYNLVKRENDNLYLEKIDDRFNLVSNTQIDKNVEHNRFFATKMVNGGIYVFTKEILSKESAVQIVYQIYDLEGNKVKNGIVGKLHFKDHSSNDMLTIRSAESGNKEHISIALEFNKMKEKKLVISALSFSVSNLEDVTTSYKELPINRKFLSYLNNVVVTNQGETYISVRVNDRKKYLRNEDWIFMMSRVGMMQSAKLEYENKLFSYSSLSYDESERELVIAGSYMTKNPEENYVYEGFYLSKMDPVTLNFKSVNYHKYDVSYASFLYGRMDTEGEVVRRGHYIPELFSMKEGKGFVVFHHVNAVSMKDMLIFSYNKKAAFGKEWKIPRYTNRFKGEGVYLSKFNSSLFLLYNDYELNKDSPNMITAKKIPGPNDPNTVVFATVIDENLTITKKILFYVQQTDGYLIPRLTTKYEDGFFIGLNKKKTHRFGFISVE